MKMRTCSFRQSFRLAGEEGEAATERLSRTTLAALTSAWTFFHLKNERMTIMAAYSFSPISDILEFFPSTLSSCS